MVEGNGEDRELEGKRIFTHFSYLDVFKAPFVST